GSFRGFLSAGRLRWKWRKRRRLLGSKEEKGKRRTREHEDVWQDHTPSACHDAEQTGTVAPPPVKQARVILLFSPPLSTFHVMHFDPWILAFSAVPVIATILLGFWSAKKSKTAHDFFVAGRSVSVGWNASAISGEYLSAASFMGVAGMVMSSGYDALWYPVCYACGYLFLLLFIAGPLRRFGAYTIPDF